jgi:hypothetical protein
MTGPVMLGYVHGGTVRAEFMASVLSSVSGPEATGLIGGITDMSAGPMVSLARNMLMSRFLDTGLEWLWCVDTDIMFSPGTLPALLSVADPDERPLMSALYHISLGSNPVPAMFLANNSGGRLVFSPIAEWDDGDIIQADGVGAGCLLIHRDSLLKMRKDHDDQSQWWREILAGDQYVGEDLSFCIRAGASGIPVHVDTAVQVGHVKAVVIGGISP